MEKITKGFKVVTVSQNTNSFGLRGFIAVARDGQAFEAAANYLNVPKKGDLLFLPARIKDDGSIKVDFASGRWEIPQERKPAPQEVADQIWRD